MCRQKGFFNLSDISTAIFEYNGKLTILPKTTKRPLTPADMNIVPPTESIMTEVIMDGRILEDNLNRLGLDLNWLNNELKYQGYKSTNEIFLGICDNNRELTLFV